MVGCALHTKSGEANINNTNVYVISKPITSKPILQRCESSTSSMHKVHTLTLGRVLDGNINGVPLAQSRSNEAQKGGGDIVPIRKETRQ